MLVETLELMRVFDTAPEEEKSVELIISLLQHTNMPFHRDQFHPGHITCSAVVLHPDGKRILLMHHHRHQRWLLPGGHVEVTDAGLADTARRKAIEETAVRIPSKARVQLVGIDVHGIPARRDEPF